MKNIKYLMLVCIGFVNSTYAMEKNANHIVPPSAPPKYEYQPYPVLSAPIPIPQKINHQSTLQANSSYVSNSSTTSNSASPSTNCSYLQQNSSSMVVSPSSTPPTVFCSPTTQYQDAHSASPTPPPYQEKDADRPASVAPCSSAQIVSTPVAHIVQAGYSVCMPAQGTQLIPFAEAADMKVVEDFEQMLNKLPPAHRVNWVIRVAKALNSDGHLALAKVAAVNGTKGANGEQLNLHNTSDTTVRKNAQLALAALKKALPTQKKWYQK